MLLLAHALLAEHDHDVHAAQRALDVGAPAARATADRPESRDVLPRVAPESDSPVPPELPLGKGPGLSLRRDLLQPPPLPIVRLPIVWAAEHTFGVHLFGGRATRLLARVFFGGMTRDEGLNSAQQWIWSLGFYALTCVLGGGLFLEPAQWVNYLGLITLVCSSLSLLLLDVRLCAYIIVRLRFFSTLFFAGVFVAAGLEYFADSRRIFLVNTAVAMVGTQLLDALSPELHIARTNVQLAVVLFYAYSYVVIQLRVLPMVPEGPGEFWTVNTTLPFGRTISVSFPQLLCYALGILILVSARDFFTVLLYPGKTSMITVTCRF